MQGRGEEALREHPHPDEGMQAGVRSPEKTGSLSTEMRGGVDVPGNGPRSGRILVVDDQSHVLEVAQMGLEELGFCVTTAISGEEAVRSFESGASEIVLVLLDMTMPGMDGGEVLSAIRQIEPKMPVVLSSGHVQATALEALPEGMSASFLQKPYDLKQLQEVVVSVLEKG